jgi:hypothetical protein
MRDVFVLLVHLIVTTVRLMRPGGIRSVVAGLCAGLLHPARLLRASVVLKPATILQLHRSLVKRKYPELITPRRERAKPGPKGPSAEIVAAVVETNSRNPRFGYQRIADQISAVFDVPLDKDTVRRELVRHYRPDPGSGGPSWLTGFGHSRDASSCFVPNR